MRQRANWSGFILAESMVGLTIAVISVSLLATVIIPGRQFEQQQELRSDRADAWHLLQHRTLKQVMIHDRSYRLGNENEVVEIATGKHYQVKE
ncbi:MAG: hypothetical protein ACTIAG_00950 [Lactobacillus sp.]|nr:hypothetical protein [Lactobacillus sp.]MDN6052047.1 hypothetical protein [Lactobacillus sp.]